MNMHTSKRYSCLQLSLRYSCNIASGVRKDGERVFTYLIKLLAGDESYDR